MSAPGRSPASPAFVVAIVGAESTGKSSLAASLAGRLRQPGRRCVLIEEHLRAFCLHQRRTPTQAEQAGIAAAQTEQIAAAAAEPGVVVADTTALQTAVYSDLVFTDASLYVDALRAHARADLTLLTALDLPWVPDGFLRDGPQVRAAVDQRIRAALHRSGTAYQVIAGDGDRRLDAALRAIAPALAQAEGTQQPSTARAQRWVHACARCGDAACERRLFSARAPQSAAPPP